MKDPRNEREAHAALAASITLRSRIDARQAAQHAAASITRHRRLCAALALLLWLAFCTALGVATFFYLSR